MLEPRRPEKLPEIAWQLMKWELERLDIGEAARHEAQRVYAAEFKRKLLALSLKDARDWAFEQIPDPVRPPNLPKSAWLRVRTELPLRQRYFGLTCYAATFEEIEARRGRYAAKTWAIYHAAGKSAPWPIAIVIAIYRSYGGGSGPHINP